MTHHLRRLALTGLVASALAALPGSTADAGMFQYGYGYSGYYSTYYSPSWWSGGYSTYYSPSYYSPNYYTSYYAPSYGYGGWGSTDCCPQTCCAPCCSPCGTGCPGGDCSVDSSGLTPRPDGSTPGGSKTYGNGTQEDKDWKGTGPKPATPGYESNGTPPAAGSGSRDQEAQKPPAAGDVTVPQKKDDASPPDPPVDKSPEAVRPANGTEGAGAEAGDGKSEIEKAPKLNGPDVATRRTFPLAGLDRKLTSTSKPERLRSTLRAQFDDVQIARRVIDPATLGSTAPGTPVARR